MQAKVKTDFRRYVISYFLLLIIFLSAIPQVAFAEAGAASISIMKENITADSTSLVISVSGVPSSGILRVIELDRNVTYDSDRLNSYKSLYFSLASSLSEGENTLVLSGLPTKGKCVYAVLRDSSGELKDYISNGVIVDEIQESPLPSDILKNCAVKINKSDSIKVDVTSVDVSVRLDESINGCYLTVFAYPGNVSFDPDSEVINKRLWSVSVTDGTNMTCDFNGNYLPLSVGYKVIACLNVPVGNDNFKSVTSNVVGVVDENGDGFEDYTYPNASIVETELESGSTSLHIDLKGDARIFEAVKEGKTSVTCAIQQYPDGKTFDFEGDYMVPLLSNYKITEPLTNQEINLLEPLRAGYRVRAVVYWEQNAKIFLPKGNDYESSFNKPDDSVLISSKAVVPSVSFSSSNIKASAEAVSVNVAGDIPDGSILIIQYLPKDAEYAGLGSGTFLTNKASVTAGENQIIPVEKGNRTNINTDNKLIAVILKSGNIIAQSDIAKVVSADTLEPFELSLVGDLYENSTQSIFKVNYDDAITTGRIFLYHSNESGTAADTERQIVSAELTRGNSVKIDIPENSIAANETIFASIYYLQPGTSDFYKNYFSIPISVRAALEEDSILILEKSFTTLSNSATVSIKGCDEFMGGRLILAVGNKGANPDSRNQLYSSTISKSGTYECNFKVDSVLKAGQDILPYLYKYDDASELTYYKSGEAISILADEDEEIETVVAFTTPSLQVGNSSVWYKTNFKSTLNGTISIYACTSNTYHADDENKLLYRGTVAPSETTQKISFSNESLTLSAGKYVIALLSLSDGSTAMSSPILVNKAPVIVTPTITINENEITAGDTKMKGSISFDSSSVDSATYKAYIFEGETLDMESETTKVLNTGIIYKSTQNVSIYFNESYRPLKVGANIQLVLTTVRNGISSEYSSDVITVDPSPNWGTPTAAIEEVAVMENATSVSATITYDEKYLTMDGYYCNVAIYSFPSKYSDEYFEENELHETIAVRVGETNSTTEKVVRGQIEIPIKSGVALKSGDRLIIKLRLPHTEWEEEEADYLSTSVAIIAENADIPEPRVLLYNLGTDSSRGLKIRNILDKLGIPAVTVEKKHLDENIGYLVGRTGFEETEGEFTEEGYETEFILMSDLGEAVLYRFLVAMQTENIRINHKEAVTDTNQFWTFQRLMGDIELEHDVFKAILELDKLIKLAEELDEKDYNANVWNTFEETSDNASNVLGSEKPSLNDLQTATNNLKAEYQKLKGVTDIVGNLVISALKSGDSYILTANVLNGPENAVYNYTWSDGTKNASVSDISQEKLALMHVTAISDGYTGELKAQLYVPDKISKAVISERDKAFTINWIAAGVSENKMPITKYVAEITLKSSPENVVKSVNCDGIDTSMNIDGLSNGISYIIKLYAVSLVGRSDSYVFEGTPSASSSSSGGHNTGSSGTTTANISTTEIKTDVQKSIDSGKTPEVKVSSNGTIAVNMETSKVLANEKSGLEVSSANGKKSVVIPSEVFKENSDKQLSLTVKSVDSATITKAKDAIRKDVKSILIDGSDKSITLALSTGTDKTNITKFTEPAKLSLMLEPSDLEKVSDVNNLTIARVNADNTLTYIGGKLAEKTGEFTANTDMTGDFILVEKSNIKKITLQIENTEVDTNGVSARNDIAPVVIEDRTMIPLRYIAETLDCEVGWDQNTKTVTINVEGKELTLVIDETIEGAYGIPIIKQNRTLVPLRYIAEKLGANVLWIPSTKTIEIVK